MKRQKPSGAHFRKFRKKKKNATASSQVFMAVIFLKGSNSSASSGFPENQ
jgi:hypothetical protein